MRPEVADRPIASLLHCFCRQPAPGQERPIPSPGDGMIDEYLARDVDLLSRRVFEGVDVSGGVGGDPAAPEARVFPDARSLAGSRADAAARHDHGDHSGEGPVVDREDPLPEPPGPVCHGQPVPAHGTSKERLPAILYLCGHAGRGRDGNKTAFQDHGMWFARNGYVAFLIDTLQLGEVAGVHHGTYNLGRWWWQAAGYTPAGVECWNGIRAIDYLVTRPESTRRGSASRESPAAGRQPSGSPRPMTASPAPRHFRHERPGKLRRQPDHQRPLRLHVHV